LFGPGFVVQEIDKIEYIIMRQQNILLVLDKEENKEIRKKRWRE